MAIIDTAPEKNKFDQLQRTNKGVSLLSLIFASYNAQSLTGEGRKNKVHESLKEAYNLFKEKGAGTYGDGSRPIERQFASHYTMAYEMGIWEDSDFTLSSLAIEVAKQNITVKQYISTVFLNLFAYFKVNGENQYKHFLYEILTLFKNENIVTNKEIQKEILSTCFGMSSEQANMLYNYLIDTEFFETTTKGTFKIDDKWVNKVDYLIEICNLEYKDKNMNEVQTELRDKEKYSNYVTKGIEKLMDTNNSQCSEDQLAASLEVENIKDQFLGWLGKRKKSDGQPYSPNVIKNYVGSLSRDTKKLVEEKLNGRDFYELETKKEFLNLLENAEGSSRFDEVNKVNNNQFSSAIKLFKEFLDYCFGDDEKIQELNILGKSLIEIKGHVKGVNKLYFGAPGTGKSFGIKTYINDVFRENGSDYEYRDQEKSPNVLRTTLHPEFTYNDFVGQIMPKKKSNGEITYDFVPRIFTEALARAFANPHAPIFLILEELSRANVAAVFGDLFQLLDRDSNGTSEYSIHNDLIYKGIIDILEGGNDYFHGQRGEDIYIPHNLFIIGTVNTSDQNVFVMDTAFKRRFDFEYMNANDVVESQNHFEIKLDGLETTWNELYIKINDFIIDKENGLGLNEDKQLGQFFIKFNKEIRYKDSEKTLIDYEKDYNYMQLRGKLLQYLWEDVQASSYTDKSLFNVEVEKTSFAKLYGKLKNGEDIFNKDITKDINKVPKATL